MMLIVLILCIAGVAAAFKAIDVAHQSVPSAIIAALAALVMLGAGIFLLVERGLVGS